MTRATLWPSWIQRAWLITSVLVLTVFVWSRLAGLDLSLYHDEIYTVDRYVENGPAAIFFGNYQPNNHVLFSLLTWLTFLVAGSGEVVMRFWAAAPAALATILVVVWTYRRYGTVAATTAGVLLVTSPLVAQLSVLARGYGLAFLGVALLMIGSVDALAEARPRRSIVLAAAGALIGTLTLPVFGLAALGTALALLVFRAPDRAFILKVFVPAGLVCLAWYAPLIDDLVRTSGQEFGSPLAWHGPISGPIQTLLFPTFRLLLPGVLEMSAGGHAVDAPSTRDLWYAVASATLVVGAIALARRSLPRLTVLLAPVIVSFTVLTLTRFFVEPRFVSYLIAPIAVLLGVAADRIVGRRNWTAALALTTAVAVTLAALPSFAIMTRVPLEAFREVGAYSATLEGPIITNSQRPTTLGYYLPRAYEVRTGDDLREVLCGPGPLVFVHHPLLAEPVDTTCLRERGAQRQRFLQRDRGQWIDVWDVTG